MAGLACRAEPATDGSNERIVSLVPAVTEMLFAIGAGSAVVGVSNYDSFPAEVQSLPRVGALLDPDTERILALQPDLVVLYGSQSDLEGRVAGAGIRTLRYRHGGIAAMFENLRELGAATGRSREAAHLEQRLRSRIDSVRGMVAGEQRPRTLLVFERQPGTLRNMYVSGGSGFLHEMLDAAGGTNVFADIARESVQPSHETLLIRAPEVILEVHAVGLLEGAREDRSVWMGLPSIPAVRSDRIYALSGEHLVVPGPRLADGVEAMARALHPDRFR